MIQVIDYKIGNLHNLKNALDSIGADVKIVANPKELKKAKKILIPGVGSFKQAMANFIDLGFKDEILHLANNGVPIFGVCVGMQILFSSSQEDGLHEGLKLINGKVIKFSRPAKIPHIGWNQVKYLKNSPLFKDIPNNSWFYFLHSYHVEANNNDSIAESEYDQEFFCSVAIKNNICGAQFHPEKSQNNGLKLLKNFCFHFDPN